MASKAAILMSLNLLFFTMVSSTCVPCSNSPPKAVSSPPKGHKSPPAVPQPKPPSPPKGHNSPPAVPQPKPPSPPTPSKQPSCPKDTLKLGVCADLLGLVNVQLGSASNSQCCSLIQGLTDLDAAVCLCTALKANVLGINLNIPINLALLLNLCGKQDPNGFSCT